MNCGTEIIIDLLISIFVLKKVNFLIKCVRNKK